MQSAFGAPLAWLGVMTFSLVLHPVWLQKPPKRKVVHAKAGGCCEELKELKMQVANLSALIEELSKKQDDELGNAIMQVMELEGSFKQMDVRLNDVEGKYSEMNNQLGIVQLQAVQTVTQTSAGKKGLLPPQEPQRGCLNGSQEKATKPPRGHAWWEMEHWSVQNLPGCLCPPSPPGKMHRWGAGLIIAGP